MPENIGTLVKDYWPLVFTLATTVWAVVAYFITHWRELSWKRTEFICTQSQYLDTDADLVEMVKILEGRHPEINIAQIYDDGSKIDPTVCNSYKQRFDRLLNFLWRLCFAYLVLETLSKREIVCVGWYLRCIAKHPSLVNYCNSHGYNDIITVIKRQGYPMKEQDTPSPPPNKSLEPAAG